MPVTASLNLNVAQADRVPALVSIAPALTEIKKGQEVRFTATVFDQFGVAFPADAFDVDFSVSPNLRRLFYNSLQNWVDVDVRDETPVGEVGTVTATVANT